MSAIQLFRDQHKSIRGHFAQLDVIDQRMPERKAPILKQTFMDLEIHFQLEEEFLYEAIRAKADPGTSAELERCYTAHAQVRGRMHALRSQDIHNEYFNTGLQTFIRDVEEHLELEEQELFPLSKMVLGDDALIPMEKPIRARMKELLSKPEYRDSKPEFAQDPRGGEQMRTKKTA